MGFLCGPSDGLRFESVHHVGQTARNEGLSGRVYPVVSGRPAHMATHCRETVHHSGLNVTDLRTRCTILGWAACGTRASPARLQNNLCIGGTSYRRPRALRFVVRRGTTCTPSGDMVEVHHELQYALHVWVEKKCTGARARTTERRYRAGVGKIGLCDTVEGGLHAAARPRTPDSGQILFSRGPRVW